MMRKILIALTAALFTVTTAYAGTAFFVREVQTGGMTKQCVYDYLGSQYVITVSTVSLCPLTIEV